MNSRRSAAVGQIIAAGAFIPRTCPAAVMLAPPFTDHAVLQRNIAVPVWGQAAAGDKIVVDFRGQRLATTAGPDGRWSVQLAPMPAAVEGADLVVAGANTITLHDVVVGEVWLASGQSNMEWPLNLARNNKQEMAAANSPLIRHLRIEHSPSDLPASSVKTGGWQAATPETAGNFSAVGYFFARALTQKLGVPVGIINSSWGGVPIESWLAEPVLRTTQAWTGFDAQWQEALKVFPQKMAEYPAVDAAWRKADEAARATGQPNTLPWPHPPAGPGTAYAPGALFNGMIAPLVPYALRGALWYQGESNAGHPGEYPELIRAMIRDWRTRWALGDFPFYFVQIPNYADGKPDGQWWPLLREAQAAALALPNTAMAVAIDVGEAENIHPTNKQPVGERLALIAEANTYHLPVEWSGPVFQSAVRDGVALRVTFAHAAGLVSRAALVTGFEIAGTDKAFHKATARIDGETVVVSATEVAKPDFVRYAWANNPVVSLYNGAGLPAAPFRSDN
jgi:sialate O-acetylesterase